VFMSRCTCAWCGRFLHWVDCEGESHGICQECMEKEIAKLDGENVPTVAAGETG